MIIINPIPGQEEENATFLENVKAGIWLKNDDNIKEVLEKVLNSEDLQNELKQNALSLAKPNSTKNICEVLLG